MLEARGICRHLGGHPVLENVDLAVPAGTVMAVLGANGAGKTTLLRILAGLLRPGAGSVLWQGHPLPGDAAGRRRIGLLAHQPFLYDGLTARENLAFYARLYGLTRPEGRIADLIRRLGLTAWADQPVSAFSRGMVQRLALARTLLHDPPVLLLDEPRTGMDPPGVALVDAVLAEARAAGRCVVMVTHDLPGALAAADHILVLRRGRVAAAGPAAAYTPGALQPLFAAGPGPARAAVPGVLPVPAQGGGVR